MQNSTLLKFVRLGLGLVFFYVLNTQAHLFYNFIHGNSEAELVSGFFLLSIIFALSFGVFYLSQGTGIPSFVVAIFFGLVSRDILAPIVQAESALSVIVGLGATLILFSGGIETPWENFKRLIGKILSVSFLGLGLTALLFSVAMVWIAKAMGMELSMPVVILLGAVLASTDPASIIPILKLFRFNNRDTRDIIVSESAVTDVTGTLLTVIFLSLLAGGAVFTDVLSGYRQLLTGEALFFMTKQIAYGGILGIIGYFMLETLVSFKRSHDQEFEADSAFFMFVPIIIFAIALLFGGSGYLAAFIAGLLFVLSEHLNLTEKFFNQTIEGFLKPTIFLLLGALVDPQQLIAYAPLGLAGAFVFIFIIRPIAVWISLAPFMVFEKGDNKLSWREVVFISFVRETGAIPAVLLVTIVASGVEGLNGLVPVGMWVILATLILQPPFTPAVAKWLKVGQVIGDANTLQIDEEKPVVVLTSRGESYKHRLGKVVDWADLHKIKNVILLHCPEDRYTPEFEEETRIQAEGLFASINKERELRKKLPMKFTFISRRGFLQDNVNDLAKENNVTTIFAGKKVLDYRLSEIKQLTVPFYFLD
jgi:cell volume regulation protein A